MPIGQISQQPADEGIAAGKHLVVQRGGFAEDHDPPTAEELLGGQRQVSQPFAGVVRRNAAGGGATRLAPSPATGQHRLGEPAGVKRRTPLHTERIPRVVQTDGGRMRRGLVRLFPVSGAGDCRVEAYPHRQRFEHVVEATVGFAYAYGRIGRQQQRTAAAYVIPNPLEHFRRPGTVRVDQQQNVGFGKILLREVI